jgi:hypothetical protein
LQLVWAGTAIRRAAMEMIVTRLQPRMVHTMLVVGV